MTTLNSFFKKHLSKVSCNKKHLFILLIAVIPNLSKGQSGEGWGIKAGLNYNANGEYFDAISDAYEDPKAYAGFNVGLFAKTKGFVFLRPELMYTNTNTKYDNNNFNMQKIDGVLLAGLDIIELFTVFIGPSAQYILDSKFDSITISDLDTDLTFGLNFGVGLNLKKVGIDLRYEGSFTKNEASFISIGSTTAVSQIETRSNQLILNLSIML